MTLLHYIEMAMSQWAYSLGIILAKVIRELCLQINAFKSDMQLSRCNSMLAMYVVITESTTSQLRACDQYCDLHIATAVLHGM